MACNGVVKCKSIRRINLRIDESTFRINLANQPFGRESPSNQPLSLFCCLESPSNHPYHPPNQPMSSNRITRITRINLPFHSNQPLSLHRITRITLSYHPNQPMSLYPLPNQPCQKRINLCNFFESTESTCVCPLTFGNSDKHSSEFNPSSCR